MIVETFIIRYQNSRFKWIEDLSCVDCCFYDGKCTSPVFCADGGFIKLNV